MPCQVSCIFEERQPERLPHGKMFQGVQDQKQHEGPEQFRSHHSPYQQHIIKVK